MRRTDLRLKPRTHRRRKASSQLGHLHNISAVPLPCSISMVLTTLPSAYETSAQKVTPLLRRQARHIEGIIIQELIELWHKLGKESERQETSVYHPGVASGLIRIPFPTDQDNAWQHGRRSRGRIRIKSDNSGVRYSIFKPETTKESKHISHGINTSFAYCS